MLAAGADTARARACFPLEQLGCENRAQATEELSCVSWKHAGTWVPQEEVRGNFREGTKSFYWHNIHPPKACSPSVPAGGPE